MTEEPINISKLTVAAKFFQHLAVPSLPVKRVLLAGLPHPLP